MIYVSAERQVGGAATTMARCNARVGHGVIGGAASLWGFFVAAAAAAAVASCFLLLAFCFVFLLRVLVLVLVVVVVFLVSAVACCLLSSSLVALQPLKLQPINPISPPWIVYQCGLQGL